jgi:hypothetical protein
MSAPKQRNEFDGKTTPWEILYFCLALDCDFPILEAVTKSNYSTIVDSEGTIRKYWKNILYYEQFANGTKKHYKFGQLHREDGPAIEEDGYNAWYRNGQRHREDGPAVILASGVELWYHYGVQYYPSEKTRLR